jgi:hypothetical protein
MRSPARQSTARIGQDPKVSPGPCRDEPQQ